MSSSSGSERSSIVSLRKDARSDENGTDAFNTHHRYGFEDGPTAKARLDSKWISTWASDRGEAPTSAVRRLSDLEESETRFRGHRDSVTLARSQMLKSGRVSPELLLHRATSLTARKRMHARNCATSDI